MMRPSSNDDCIMKFLYKHLMKCQHLSLRQRILTNQPLASHNDDCAMQQPPTLQPEHLRRTSQLSAHAHKGGLLPSKLHKFPSSFLCISSDQAQSKTIALSCLFLADKSDDIALTFWSSQHPISIVNNVNTEETHWIHNSHWHYCCGFCSPGSVVLHTTSNPGRPWRNLLNRASQSSS